MSRDLTRWNRAGLGRVRYVDANEGLVGTATQRESLHRLTAMLDYAPHPSSRLPFEGGGVDDSLPFKGRAGVGMGSDPHLPAPRIRTEVRK